MSAKSCCKWLDIPLAKWQEVWCCKLQQKGVRFDHARRGKLQYWVIEK